LATRVGMPLSELVAIEQPGYRLSHQQLTQLADALDIKIEHLTD